MWRVQEVRIVTQQHDGSRFRLVLHKLVGRTGTENICNILRYLAHLCFIHVNSRYIDYVDKYVIL